MSRTGGRLIPALEPDEVVLGGGNVKKLKSSRRDAAAGTTPTPSSEGFACGKMTHLPRVPRNKAFLVVRKKPSPHQNQKTRWIQKNTLKGAAA